MIMQNKHRDTKSAYAKRKGKRALWQRVVSVLVSIVVFCTTYALILPALTLEKNAVCGIAEHIHEAVCFSDDDATLVCEINEHTHGEECYDLSEDDDTFVGLRYLCGQGEHIHSDSCSTENGEVICSVPFHIHEAVCVVEDLDTSADTETQLQWESTMAQVMITGNIPKDIQSIAKSQLSYSESEKNVVLTGDGLRGYTRYGARVNDPYGDWNAHFASFCMAYAGKDRLPEGKSPAELLQNALEMGLYKTKEEYTPRAGDAVFFDRRAQLGDEPTGERVAIITEIAGDKLTVIEGDRNGKVESVAYEISDPSIIGYMRTPAGEVHILEKEGEDYKVTVTFSESAGIPDTAILAVREILPDTDEYEGYYRESVKTLLSESDAKTEKDLGISFVRFFDISFIVNGEEKEPLTPVDIRITYDEGFSVGEEEKGVAVHFAESGAEVLSAFTSKTESEKIDTFEFTQNSFSVTGTVVANARIANAYKAVNMNSLDGSGATKYLVYTKLGDRYYAINGNGGATEITFADDGVTVETDVTDNMVWTFRLDGSAGNYIIRNAGTGKHMHSFYNNAYDNGVTTTGAYSSTLVPSGDGKDMSFKIRSNSYYSYAAASGGSAVFSVTQEGAGQQEGSKYYVAALPASTYHVWLDGTDGGLMGLYGSPNEYRAVSGAEGRITLPETWTSPSKYTYKLNGWYDIVDHKYYKPGETAIITQNTVFYADWVAGTYDVGFENEHTVDSIDTDTFITTHVFDYNVLLNALSHTHQGQITATGHSESWTLVTDGKVPYGEELSTEFAFLDYDGSGDISYSHGRDMEMNYNRSVITPGIIEHVESVSGKSLIDILFDPDVWAIGKTYLGTGNYLFQYMDETTPNYDGHDGYYYFHSRLNAASYNQTEQRFYLYDYLERTSDSWKDKGPGEFSDFLPFNSPYANIPAGQRLPTYVDADGTTGYMFDAKDAYSQGGTQYSSTGNAGTNYWFGIRTDVEFFLPNDAGEKDKYNNYGNISTKGEHMVFEFHGDDDLWVFVDGKLVLDVGGVHGVEYGQIDFSTGYVTSGEGEGEEQTYSFEELLGYNITEGTHTLTVYYMERGSSQSNCSIYFNIAPRYDLEITKEDVFTAELLDGAEFTVYTDEACQHPAQLWASKEAHEADMDDGTVNDSMSTFTVVNGTAACWGISAGKTYYIKETKSPEGYPVNDDIIRITLNNRGTATIETTTLNGADGYETEGFAVIKQDVNDTLKIVALTVTNQHDGDTTQLRVEKEWDTSSVNIPNSIEVYLTVNGRRVGRTATLTEANGWSYKWTGLPKYLSDGVTPIAYTVEEVQVPGYETEHVKTEEVVERIDWIKTDAMADSSTYILVNGGQALSYDGSSFSWVTPEFAKTEGGVNAQWSVTTNQYGFRLTNGSGYNLTYEDDGGPEGDYFYGTMRSEIELNQVIYFLENRLVAHANDYYFQFNSGGDAVAQDGLVFTLYRKDVLTGTLVNIKNTPIEEDKQTHLEVNKIFADLLDHSGDEVTIKLFADGKDTGRRVVLNEENGWRSSFEGLPYYASDGVTPVKYTVVEEEFEGYDPTYSEPVTVDPRKFNSWANANALEAGGVYRFVYGAVALGVDMSGNLISTVNDPADETQQWQVEAYGTGFVLKNARYGYYLDSDNSNLFTAGNAGAAAQVVLTNNVLKIGNRFLQLTASGATSSWYENNGTALTVTKRAQVVAMNGTSITVTNTEEAYVLPSTGGEGIPSSLYKFGGALSAAAATMYICESGRKRKKGGEDN